MARQKLRDEDAEEVDAGEEGSLSASQEERFRHSFFLKEPLANGVNRCQELASGSTRISRLMLCSNEMSVSVETTPGMV